MGAWWIPLALWAADQFTDGALSGKSGEAIPPPGYDFHNNIWYGELAPRLMGMETPRYPYSIDPGLSPTAMQMMGFAQGMGPQPRGGLPTQLVGGAGSRMGNPLGMSNQGRPMQQTTQAAQAQGGNIGGYYPQTGGGAMNPYGYNPQTGGIDWAAMMSRMNTPAPSLSSPNASFMSGFLPRFSFQGLAPPAMNNSSWESITSWPEGRPPEFEYEGWFPANFFQAFGQGGGGSPGPQRLPGSKGGSRQAL